MYGEATLNTDMLIDLTRTIFNLSVNFFTPFQTCGPHLCHEEEEQHSTFVCYMPSRIIGSFDLSSSLRILLLFWCFTLANYQHNQFDVTPLFPTGTGEDNDESILDQVKRIGASHKTGGEDGGGGAENRQQNSGDGTVQQECMDTGTSGVCGLYCVLCQPKK